MSDNLFDHIFELLTWKSKFSTQPDDNVKVIASWWEKESTAALKKLGKMKEETRTTIRALHMYEIANTRKMVVVEEPKNERRKD